MPQKLNPDVAELVRGKAGTALGRLTGLLAVVKGLPLAYNRDLQEDKTPLFAARHDTRSALAALGVLLAGIELDRDAMSAACADPLLRATDAAEELVREGMPFRDAHEQVARAVRDGTFVPPTNDRVVRARSGRDRAGARGCARPLPELTRVPHGGGVPAAPDPHGYLDLQPPHVAAIGAAGVASGRAAVRRLRVRRSAFEARHRLSAVLTDRMKVRHTGYSLPDTSSPSPDVRPHVGETEKSGMSYTRQPPIEQAPSVAPGLQQAGHRAGRDDERHCRSRRRPPFPPREAEAAAAEAEVAPAVEQAQAAGAAAATGAEAGRVAGAGGGAGAPGGGGGAGGGGGGRRHRPRRPRWGRLPRSGARWRARLGRRLLRRRGRFGGFRRARVADRSFPTPRPRARRRAPAPPVGCPRPNASAALPGVERTARGSVRQASASAGAPPPSTLRRRLRRRPRRRG